MKTTIKTSISSRLGATLCLAYGAATVGSLQTLAANAAEESPPTRLVSFADLDISKPAGVQTLYRRIEAAAHQVCEIDGISPLQKSVMERGCIKQAVDNAVKGVNSVALTNLHAGMALRLASR